MKARVTTTMCTMRHSSILLLVRYRKEFRSEVDFLGFRVTFFLEICVQEIPVQSIQVDC